MGNGANALRACTLRRMRSSPRLSAWVLASLVLSSGTALAQQTKPKPPVGNPVKPRPKPKAADEPATRPTTAPAAASPASADPTVSPPPAPPPWSGTTTPTSTAGTQLMPPTPSGPPPSLDAQPPAPAGQADQVTIDNRFKMLEARVAADEKLDAENAEKLAWLRGFKLTGYVQPQFILQSFDANASPNAGAAGLPDGIGPNDVIAKADGTTTNSTFFRLRRARLKAEYMPTDFARFVMELDPTPAGGPTAGVGTLARNVEAMGIATLAPDHVAELGVGIFKVPFGFEVLQSDADRNFIERSYGEQSMFPAEYDTGARVHGSHFGKKLDVQLAVINGITIGEKTFAILPDLNKSKDVVGARQLQFRPPRCRRQRLLRARSERRWSGAPVQAVSAERRQPRGRPPPHVLARGRADARSR